MTELGTIGAWWGFTVREMAPHPQRFGAENIHIFKLLFLNLGILFIHSNLSQNNFISISPFLWTNIYTCVTQTLKRHHACLKAKCLPESFYFLAPAFIHIPWLWRFCLQHLAVPSFMVFFNFNVLPLSSYSSLSLQLAACPPALHVPTEYWTDVYALTSHPHQKKYVFSGERGTSSMFSDDRSFNLFGIRPIARNHGGTWLHPCWLFYNSSAHSNQSTCHLISVHTVQHGTIFISSTITYGAEEKERKPH